MGMRATINKSTSNFVLMFGRNISIIVCFPYGYTKPISLTPICQHGYAQDIMENTSEPNEKVENVDPTTPQTGEIKPTEPMGEPAPTTSSITPTIETPTEPSVITPTETPPETPTVITPEVQSLTPTPALSEPTEAAASTPPLTTDTTETPTPESMPATILPTPPSSGRPRLKLIMVAALSLVVLAAASVGSYLVGKHNAKPMESTTSTTTSMAIPAGATIIEKCQPGLGTQYVLPKNIPDGPVYNVYKGKVIGIEYMSDLATLSKIGTIIGNLPLYGQKYDHINIMSMAAHAGYPTAHYQVDVMMVPDATAAKITCGSSSSSMSSSSSSSDTMDSSSTSKM
jgi:hypothetical protein